jgi:hypothetical protein
MPKLKRYYGKRTSKKKNLQQLIAMAPTEEVANKVRYVFGEKQT